MNFLNYRLADVRIAPEVTLAEPDIVWHQDAAKGIAYDGRQMTFTGPWPAGPIQKVVVTMLALRMEAVGLHPFHASAVRYRDRTVLFLGGESNHGKSMGQIEACRRGAMLVSTETTVIDETGRAVVGSKAPFLKKRTEGTERADKAAPERGVEKFFGAMPTWEIHTRAEQRRCRHRARDRRQLRPVARRDDPVRAAVPDVPLAPELLPAQRAAGARLRRCRSSTRTRFARPGPTSCGGSPSVRTSSSGQPPRRCSSTRWIGCSRPGPCEPSPTSGRPISPTPSPCSPSTAPTRALLAGGTDLIIRLRDGSIRPRVVVDVKRIAELDGAIREADGQLTIGARTTMTDIAADERIRREFQALAEAAAVVGSVQIRNRATLAGNICNASPAADTAPALLVYGAVVVVAGPAGDPTDPDRRRSSSAPGSRRWRAASSSPRSSCRARPAGAAPSTSAGRAGAATTSRRSRWPARSSTDGTTRLAYGSLGPRPLLVTDETGVLADPAAPDLAKMARLEALFVGASPSARSMRASPEYRLAMLHVLGLRAVGTAIERLAEGSVRR